jgi:hypothetical protein
MTNPARLPSTSRVQLHAVAIGLLAAAIIGTSTAVLATTYRESVAVQSFDSSQFDLGPIVGTYSQSFRTDPIVLTTVSVFVAHVEPQNTLTSIAFGIRPAEAHTYVRQGRIDIPARGPPGWISAAIAPIELTGDRNYRLDVTADLPGFAVYLGGGIRDRYLDGDLTGPDGALLTDKDLMFRLDATYGPGGLIGTTVRTDPIGAGLLLGILLLGATLVGIASTQRTLPSQSIPLRAGLATAIALAIFLAALAATYRLTDLT